ncbi:hypothetical protein FHR04_19015 [Deinococcus radiopugnans ATCC 19172]|uniref:Tyr recombinase domain-containing protein n=2 Tax=Deinococcus radiopugnans ATCC 19172 TaxID=585398 RepID=A0A5C4XWD4_9DEIO|nr:hypothetical protein FHR04_19015 [Deinococcus radiopugnans ATCC 19172]
MMWRSGQAETANHRANCAAARRHVLLAALCWQRQTFATNLVNAFRSLEEVQEALGHKNRNVTRRYAKLNQSRLRGTADALPDVMSGVN